MVELTQEEFEREFLSQAKEFIQLHRRLLEEIRDSDMTEKCSKGKVKAECERYQAGKCCDKKKVAEEKKPDCGCGGECDRATCGC